MTKFAILALSLSALLLSCGGSGGSGGASGNGTDGNTDGGTDGNTDGGTDGNTDGGTDGNTDGGSSSSYQVNSELLELNESPLFTNHYVNGRQVARLNDNGELYVVLGFEGEVRGIIAGLPKYDWRSGDIQFGYAVIGSSIERLYYSDGEHITVDSYFFNNLDGSAPVSYIYENVDYQYLVVTGDDVSVVQGNNGELIVNIEGGTVNGNLGSVELTGSAYTDGALSGTFVFQGIEGDFLGASYAVDGEPTTAGAFAGDNGSDLAIGGGWFEQEN